MAETIHWLIYWGKKECDQSLSKRLPQVDKS